MAFKLAICHIYIVDFKINKATAFKGNQAKGTNKASGGAKFHVVLEKD